MLPKSATFTKPSSDGSRRPSAWGDYDDYNMLSPGSESAAAGICHAKGDNASLPAQWMMYIVVDDLDASLDAVQRLGGSVLVPARGEGQRMAVIRDPAGAVAALFQVG